VPIIETIAVLLSWAVMLSGYAEPERAPQLEYKPHAFFVDEACNGQECEAVGWYNDAGVIYLDERMRSDDSSFVKSLMVHELVHYLQHLSGKYDSHSCKDQIVREREAYAIQRIYMAEAHGQAQFQMMRPPFCNADYAGQRAP
jgi:Zn-dependent peptidase ImmA (M78 family)